MTDHRIFRCETLGEYYVRCVHKSGLTVVVYPKRMHTLSASLVVHYGAQDTRFSLGSRPPHVYPNGVAHYLEHQLFTREDGSTVDEQFSALGAEVNAWTNHEKTAYTISTTENILPALRALLQFVTHPTFTEASVKKERGIISQEIRMIQDDPWDALYRRSMATMYPHHPLSLSVCGSERSIARITPEILYECYHAFYRPALMDLIVCGDITAEQVLSVADEVLTAPPTDSVSLPRRGTDGSYQTRIPVLHRSACRANVAKPIFQIAWRDDEFIADPSERIVHTLAMDMISEILFSRAGPLYNRLLEDHWITPMYSYGYTAMKHLAYHTVSGESDEPERVWHMYRHVLEEKRKIGLTEEEFERNRRVAYAAFVSNFDDTEDIVDLLVDEKDGGCDVFAPLRALNRLTFQAVDRLFRRVLGERGTSMAVAFPFEN